MGCFEQLQPDGAAIQGDLVHWAVRLADRPQHPEVSNRSAGGTLPALEYDHAESATCRGVCVRQAEDSRAHHSDVRPIRHANLLSIRCSGYKCMTSLAGRNKPAL